MADDIFKHGIRGENKPKLPSVGRSIILKRVNITYTLLLIIIVAVFYLGTLVETAGEDAAECPECEECEEQECPECAEGSEECPELECPECEFIDDTTLIYICADGERVIDADDCEITMADLLPSNVTGVTLGVASGKNNPPIRNESSNTFDNVTLSINDVKYDMKTEDFGHIIMVNYTIHNFNRYKLMPMVKISVYGENATPEEMSYAKEIFSSDEFIEKGEWISREEAVSASFIGMKNTVKLTLIDTLPERDDMIVKAAYELDIG